MISEGLDLITIDVLTTFTGAVLITNIVTHFIKDYTPPFLDKKIVTLLVAAIIMFMNQYIMGNLTIESLYISFLNSFVVAAAAMGNYEILTKKTQKRLANELKLKESSLEEEKKSTEAKKGKRDRR